MSSLEAAAPPSLLGIGLGGMFGSLARYLVDPGVIYSTGQPVATPTFVVNISGSLLIGLLFALCVERAALPTSLRGPLMIGFVGSYTTFATVVLASWRLVELGQLGAAVLNLAGSVVVGMVAVVAGIVLGRKLTGKAPDAS
ncbi:MAG TPA: CrcB family protein [Candidatus Limnocylindrales bacterium]|nr:CrcB family protein [Candidatus Limnocylindrales bacterium]